MKEIDIDGLLQKEAQRTMDVSGCKNAAEMLDAVRNSAGAGCFIPLSDDDLEQVNAAGQAYQERVKP